MKQCADLTVWSLPRPEHQHPVSPLWLSWLCSSNNSGYLFQLSSQVWSGQSCSALSSGDFCPSTFGSVFIRALGKLELKKKKRKHSVFQNRFHCTFVGYRCLLLFYPGAPEPMVPSPSFKYNMLLLKSEPNTSNFKWALDPKGQLALSSIKIKGNPLKGKVPITHY